MVYIINFEKDESFHNIHKSLWWKYKKSRKKMNIYEYILNSEKIQSMRISISCWDSHENMFSFLLI